MGAYGSPELPVVPLRAMRAASRFRYRRRWPWFLAGMASVLFLEGAALIVAATIAVLRG